MSDSLPPSLWLRVRWPAALIPIVMHHSTGERLKAAGSQIDFPSVRLTCFIKFWMFISAWRTSPTNPHPRGGHWIFKWVAHGSARRKETATWDMRDSCVAAQGPKAEKLLFSTLQSLSDAARTSQHIHIRTHCWLARSTMLLTSSSRFYVWGPTSAGSVLCVSESIFFLRSRVTYQKRLSLPGEGFFIRLVGTAYHRANKFAQFLRFGLFYYTQWRWQSAHTSASFFGGLDMNHLNKILYEQYLHKDKKILFFKHISRLYKIFNNDYQAV